MTFAEKCIIIEKKEEKGAKNDGQLHCDVTGISVVFGRIGRSEDLRKASAKEIIGKTGKRAEQSALFRLRRVCRETGLCMRARRSRPPPRSARRGSGERFRMAISDEAVRDKNALLPVSGAAALIAGAVAFSGKRIATAQQKILLGDDKSPFLFSCKRDTGSSVTENGADGGVLS